MSQQVRVPQFGKWDQAGDGQFTQYFDNARKGKKDGTLYNPNDPNANPEAFSEDSPSAHAPTSRATNEHHRNVIQQKPSTGSVQRRSSDRVNPSDAQRKNIGRDNRSFEQSPLQNQVPLRMKSPMDKRVPPSEGHANGLKHQRKQGTRPGPDDTPERAAMVPQFGEWDKNEEFTDIFNRVKQEKQTGVVSPMHTKQSYSTQRKKDNDRDFAKICCFGWFRK